MPKQIKSTITVLRAKRFVITDEETGEVKNEGVKVNYVEDWGGSIRQNHSGIELFSVTMNLEMWDKLQELPALYEATFTMQTGVKDKAVLAITDLQYSQPFGLPFGQKK